MMLAIALVSHNSFLRLAVDTILRQGGLSFRLEACRDLGAAARLAAERPLDLILVDEAWTLADTVGLSSDLPHVPILVLLTERERPVPALRGAVPIPAGSEGRLNVGVLRQFLPAAVTAHARVADQPKTAKPRGSRPADLVLIGASTGGPEALLALLGAVGALGGRAVIALHMPQDQTVAFAAHLSGRTGLGVVEVVAGSLPSPDRVSLLRGGTHYRIERRANGPRLVRSLDEAGPYRPSIDLLFSSSVDAGYSCDAVVLSGMGCDGAAGAAQIEAAGGRVFVQLPSSCVVAGMPEATLAACKTAEALAPAHIAGRIGTVRVSP